ncbi:MAG: toxin YoeB [Gammaproteobacteria bacterium]|jgi:toxin YoeB
MIESLSWTKASWEDYLYWQRQDKKTLRRLNSLIQTTMREPFKGIGKPEPLKESLSGFWSRRIDKNNRLVYVVEDKKLTIVSCRYHY